MDEVHPSEEQPLDLSEARAAYENALNTLEAALPVEESKPVVIDPAGISWLQVLLQLLLYIPLAMLRGFQHLGRDIGSAFGGRMANTKARLIRITQGRPAIIGGAREDSQNHLRMVLLETLWARDHVQEALEKRNGAPYQFKRDVLAYVMANESRLERLGQQALEAADLETSDLRDAQPTIPNADHWWWYLNYPRAKRARRLSTLWFVLAIVPALGALTLITLLAQRLAINGPDLLSGASVVAQVGLGLGSILAGRELMNDLILRGARVSWQGQITFLLASLFLIVIVVFYFLAPPAAAMVYNVFGQQAIKSGNAAEAELYLESAARLDPDPYAASLLEVGCLYQTLGSPDRAQSVFERVLEADSRLLVARYHLAEIYADRGDYDKALQLTEDGLNLLETARNEMIAGNNDFLPGINTPTELADIEYLMRISRGRAYVESGAPEQAKANLLEASDIYDEIETRQAGSAVPRRSSGVTPQDRTKSACGPHDNLEPFILTTGVNLHYHLARTYDALCDDDTTVNAAMREWRLVRSGVTSNSRQEAWRDDASRRLSSGLTCRDTYGVAGQPVSPAPAGG